MNQRTFNIAVAVAVLGIGAYLAYSTYEAHEIPPPEAIGLEQRLELLTQKVVLIGARQGDEAELRRELKDLKQRLSHLQESLNNLSLENQHSASPSAAADGAALEQAFFPNVSATLATRAHRQGRRT